MIFKLAIDILWFFIGRFGAIIALHHIVKSDMILISEISRICPVPLKISFETNGRWEGGARIPSGLRDISSLSEWIENFLKKFKILGKTYKSFMINDTKLIGQEKANLIMGLDDLLSGLFVLRKYVTEENPDHFTALENKYRFQYKVRLDSTAWTGRGIINNRYKSDADTFAEWFNNVLIKKLQHVFINYRKAMKDKILTPDERREVIEIIEIAVFDILVMERMLVTSDISM
jgi:hypothetical protein